MINTLVMDLKQLRYFLTIVEAKSIKAASEKLYIAQPSLSQRMKRLEEELGVDLLSRSAKGVAPTEAGLQLMRYARTILAQVKEAQNAVSAGSASPRGNVRVGLPSSVSLVLGVPLVEATRAQLPDVSLRLVESMSGYILEWLRNGQLDLALLYGAQRTPGVTATPLVEESLYLVSQPGSGLEDQPTTRTIEALERPDLILPARPHGLRELIEHHARQFGTMLQVNTEVDALTQIKALVRRGLGCTIVSHSAIHEELARGELVAQPLTEPTIRRSVYLVQPSDRPMTHATLAMMNLLKSVATLQIRQGRWHAQLLDIGKLNTKNRKHIIDE